MYNFSWQNKLDQIAYSFVYWCTLETSYALIMQTVHNSNKNTYTSWIDTFAGTLNIAVLALLLYLLSVQNHVTVPTYTSTNIQ